MIRKVLITLTVLAYIEFCGLIDSENFLRFKDFAKIYDILIVIVTLYVLGKLINFDQKILYIFKSKNGKIISIILLFIFMVAFSMFIRRGESFFSAMKIGRYYLPFILFFLIVYEILESRSVEFVKRLILTIGTFLSIVFIIGMILPDFIMFVLPNIRYELQESYGLILNRYYTPGFLFPIIASFLLVNILLFQEEERSNTSLKFLLLINFLGSIFQGYRSYFIAIMVSLIILVIIIRKNNIIDFRSITKISLVTILSLLILEFIFYPGLISNRIFSTVTDFIYQQGTYQDRINWDFYRIILFLDNPWFGLGFISSSSDVGQSLQLDTVGFESAYTTDTGYLTLLISFGIIGTIFYLTLFFLLLKYNLQRFKLDDPQIRIFNLSSMFFIIVLFITIITHGGFFSPYGIVPLVLLISLSEGSYLLNAQKSEWEN